MDAEKPGSQTGIELELIGTSYLRLIKRCYPCEAGRRLFFCCDLNYKFLLVLIFK